MVIQNYDEVAQQITDLLVDWAKECADYERDIYLYYDEETQLGEIDYHIGSGWLDDDHYTIYSRIGEPCYIWDAFSDYTSSDIANILNIPLEQLEVETQDYFDMGIGEEPDFWSIRDYVETRDDYMELLWEAYGDIVEENHEFYEDEAYRILDNFLKEQNYGQ